MNSFFSEILLKWYGQHARRLPWRDTQDPYAVWISEIILQQTRVAQGLDYFNRFMERFPTVDSLAAASQDEVLRYWQGLGYYSRARNLHAAARDVVAQGGFPTSYEGVRRLKGVGSYTAAAICSFAYKMPYAVVDGNVYRVLSRVFGLDVPVDSTAGQKQFAALAQELLDTSRPDVYNQAIMDFGAVQCQPKSPDCLRCPLHDKCDALATGRVEVLPVKQHRTKVSDRWFTYLWIRVGTSFLLHRRGAGDIWEGLYELPLVETAAPATAPWEDTPWQEMVEQGTLKPLRLQVRHVLSHRVIHADLYQLTLEKWPDRLPQGYFPVHEADLDQYAIPRLVEILIS